jgi:hypothetical protein
LAKNVTSRDRVSSISKYSRALAQRARAKRRDNYKRSVNDVAELTIPGTESDDFKK